MRLKATTNWTTRDGKQRRIRLYECWVNLLGRLRGGKSQSADRGYWKDKELGFSGWKEFREWAIASGYRAGVELDRVRSTEGYFEGNLQWLTKAEHTAKSRESHRVDCKCVLCRTRRRNRGERW